MIKWTATIKEKGNDHILTPSYTVSDEDGRYLDKDFFINFWGLDNPDIEWYKLNKQTL
jgi:hypothetical protein